MQESLDEAQATVKGQDSELSTLKANVKKQDYNLAAVQDECDRYQAQWRIAEVSLVPPWIDLECSVSMFERVHGFTGSQNTERAGLDFRSRAQSVLEPILSTCTAVLHAEFCCSLVVVQARAALLAAVNDCNDSDGDASDEDDDSEFGHLCPEPDLNTYPHYTMDIVSARTDALLLVFQPCCAESAALMACCS